ncbi:unnamed protein product [Pylaiella littoralis]
MSCCLVVFWCKFYLRTDSTQVNGKCRRVGACCVGCCQGRGFACDCFGRVHWLASWKTPRTHATPLLAVHAFGPFFCRWSDVREKDAAQATPASSLPFSASWMPSRRRYCCTYDIRVCASWLSDQCPGDFRFRVFIFLFQRFPPPARRT